MKDFPAGEIYPMFLTEAHRCHARIKRAQYHVITFDCHIFFMITFTEYPDTEPCLFVFFSGGSNALP